jgi:hypothetical protein
LAVLAVTHQEQAGQLLLLVEHQLPVLVVP